MFRDEEGCIVSLGVVGCSGMLIGKGAVEQVENTHICTKSNDRVTRIFPSEFNTKSQAF